MLSASHSSASACINRSALIPWALASRTRELEQQASFTGQPIGIILGDLDHFKRVNDTHGHGTGDDVLRALARAVQDQVRELDVVARSVRVRNTGSEPLILERVLSGAVPLPPGEYDAWTLHGQWGREFGLRSRQLLPGKFATESRRGTSSHEAHPWFAVRPRVPVRMR